MPEGLVKIGQNAFNNSKMLLRINIPHSVTEMGERVFEDCKSLLEVDFNPNISTIPDMTFDNCYNLEKVNIPESIESFGQGCFWYCKKLKEITIPKGLKSMNGNSLVGTNPFIGCSSLSSIIVDAQNKTYDSRNNCNAIIKTSDNVLLVGCKNTIIPKTIKEIGSGAFYWCIGLVEVDIPEGVEIIGSGAFSACINLEKVILPSTVTTIGLGAFGGEYRTNDSEEAKSMCIKSFVSNIVTPTDIDKEVFICSVMYWDEVSGQGWRTTGIEDTYNYGTLYVPYGTKEKYTTTEGWKCFKNVVEKNNGQAIKGDVNSDGKVSAADIVDLTIIIGSENNYMRGDVNGDGKVDIADIIAVCGIILAK